MAAAASDTFCSRRGFCRRTALLTMSVPSLSLSAADAIGVPSYRSGRDGAADKSGRPQRSSKDFFRSCGVRRPGCLMLLIRFQWSCCCFGGFIAFIKSFYLPAFVVLAQQRTHTHTHTRSAAEKKSVYVDFCVSCVEITNIEIIESAKVSPAVAILVALCQQTPFSSRGDCFHGDASHPSACAVRCPHLLVIAPSPYLQTSSNICKLGAAPFQIL